MTDSLAPRIKKVTLPSFLPSFLLSFLLYSLLLTHLLTRLLTSDTFTFTKHERQQSRTLVALVRLLQIRTTSLILVEKNRVVEVFRTT